MTALANEIFAQKHQLSTDMAEIWYGRTKWPRIRKIVSYSHSYYREWLVGWSANLSKLVKTAISERTWLKFGLDVSNGPGKMMTMKWSVGWLIWLNGVKSPFLNQFS